MANTLSGIHVIWFLLVLAGAGMAIWGKLQHLPRLAAVFNGILLITIISWIVAGIGILADWESEARLSLGQQALSGGFIVYCIGKIGIPLTTLQLSWITYGVIIIALVAQLIWMAWARWGNKCPSSRVTALNAVIIVLTLLAFASFFYFQYFQKQREPALSEIVSGRIIDVSENDLIVRTRIQGDQIIKLDDVAVIRVLSEQGTVETAERSVLTEDMIIAADIIENESAQKFSITILPKTAPDALPLSGTEEE